MCVTLYDFYISAKYITIWRKHVQLHPPVKAKSIPFATPSKLLNAQLHPQPKAKSIPFTIRSIATCTVTPPIKSEVDTFCQQVETATLQNKMQHQVAHQMAKAQLI